MQHPDEGTIHTWLDGELSAEDATAFQAHVAGCEQCAAAVAEARGLIAGSSRIVSSLDSVNAGVIPAARPKRLAWYSTTQFRAAAALLLIAGTSLVIVNRNETKSDSVTAVAVPRVAVTDAISRESSAAVVPQKAAAAKQTVRETPSVRPSNSVLAGSSPPAATEKRQADAAAAYSPLPGVAGGAQMALKSAQPRAVMPDSAATVAIADELVVGGDALKLIRTDSMPGFTQRVFEMANGVQLIMSERSNSFAPAAQPPSAKIFSISPQASAARNAPIVAAPPAKDQVKQSDYRTITWVDAATGRFYSLTGPFPPEQLETFKARLLKLSR